VSLVTLVRELYQSQGLHAEGEAFFSEWREKLMNIYSPNNSNKSLLIADVGVPVLNAQKCMS
jgi:hypothetical protein